MEGSRRLRCGSQGVASQPSLKVSISTHLPFHLPGRQRPSARMDSPLRRARHAESTAQPRPAEQLAPVQRPHVSGWRNRLHPPPLVLLPADGKVLIPAGRGEAQAGPTGQMGQIAMRGASARQLGLRGAAPSTPARLPHCSRSGWTASPACGPHLKLLSALASSPHCSFTRSARGGQGLVRPASAPSWHGSQALAANREAAADQARRPAPASWGKACISRGTCSGANRRPPFLSSSDSLS